MYKDKCEKKMLECSNHIHTVVGLHVRIESKRKLVGNQIKI